MRTMCASCAQVSSAFCARTEILTSGSFKRMDQASEAARQLKALREKSGISVRDMAMEMGMKPNGYTHYENRFKKPFLPTDVAQRAAKVLSARGIPEEDILSLAGIVEAAKEHAEATGAQTPLVSVYDVKASAGNGILVEDERVIEQLAFPPDYLSRITKAKPKDLAIIGVKGDSMSPTIGDDDVVMIDTSKRDLSFDGLFVIKDGGASLLVKRIGRGARSGHIMVISDNPTYPNTERAVEDIEVVGKVVWYGRKV